MRTDCFDDTLGPLCEEQGAGPMGEQLSERRDLCHPCVSMAELTRPRTEQLRNREWGSGRRAPHHE